MKKSFFSFSSLLLCLLPLQAQETLLHTDFSNGYMDSLRLTFSEGPVGPKVDVVESQDAPEEVGASVVRLDDSDALKQEGYYHLIASFPPQYDGVLVATTFVRVLEEQLQSDNAALDIRMSLGGEGGSGNIPIATYLRIQNIENQFLWSVYDPDQSRHRKIDMPIVPGDWYKVVQRIHLENKTYDWSIQNVSNPGQEEKVEGKEETFYQTPDILTFLTFASVTRGGGIEIANLSVERVDP